MPSPFRFSALIKLVGINPCVEVPARVVSSLGSTRAAVLVKVASNKKTAPKKDTLKKDAARLKAVGRLADGGWFRTTLVPLRSGATRLYLHGWMRETANVSVGDTVKITLKLDRASRELDVPPALQAALAKDAKAQAAWDALPPSHRREMLSYLNFLKSPDALERNVQKAVVQLLRRGVKTGSRAGRG